VACRWLVALRRYRTGSGDRRLQVGASMYCCDFCAFLPLHANRSDFAAGLQLRPGQRGCGPAVRDRAQHHGLSWRIVAAERLRSPRAKNSTVFCSVFTVKSKSRAGLWSRPDVCSPTSARTVCMYVPLQEKTQNSVYVCMFLNLHREC